jgi:APA family basic amino acid/polyamine antiporter
MLRHLFRKKTTLDETASVLNRCLTAYDLVMLGIGCIIGTGIFVLTGIAAANLAGPGVILSFIISGLACAFAALSYAELSSSVGGCGSAYGYTYVTFGELIAWLVGWILLLEYGLSIAAVANGWSGYFNNALKAVGLSLPTHLITTPSNGGWINLPASGIILLIMGLLAMGVKESVKFNAAMVFIKVFAILLFMAVAFFHVNPDNWSPFLPFGWFETLPSGQNVGVLAGASIVFFAYMGFDAVSTAADEAVNPRRDLPIGILGSLVVCTIVYILVAALLTGIVPYTELNVSSPVSHALDLIGYGRLSGVIALGVIAGLTTVMVVLYYALTRVILAMSRDGLLPMSLSLIHPKTQTPIRVIYLCGLIIAAFAGTVSLGALAEIVNIGTLAAFVVVCMGVIAQRKKTGLQPQSFQNRAHPVIPLLGIFCCGLLMVFLPLCTWIRFLSWNALGLIVYFSYAYHHSKLN